MIDQARTFRAALRTEEFLCTAQLKLDEDSTRADISAQAAELSGLVDAVSVPANPQGEVGPAGLAVAALLLEHGIDPILHIATRDLNRLALRSELLGAAALGITSLVILRGESLPEEFLPKTKQVYEFGAKKFLVEIGRFNQFQTQRNEPEFYLGTMARVFDPGDDWEPVELSAKADVGAQFVITQACADTHRIRNYMAALVATKMTHRLNVIVSVPVLPSADAARHLNERSRRSPVPETMIERLEEAGSPAATGIEICAEALREIRDIPGIGGANLLPLGDPADAATAIRRLRS